MTFSVANNHESAPCRYNPEVSVPSGCFATKSNPKRLVPMGVRRRAWWVKKQGLATRYNCARCSAELFLFVTNSLLHTIGPAQRNADLSNYVAESRTGFMLVSHWWTFHISSVTPKRHPKKFWPVQFNDWRSPRYRSDNTTRTKSNPPCNRFTYHDSFFY